MLAPGLVDGDGGAVGQVHRTAAVQHRQAHPVGDARMLQHVVGQSSRLGAEQQDVAGLVGDVGVRRRGRRGEGVDVAVAERLKRGIQAWVDGDDREVVIVEPGPPQLGVGEVEPERLDQVEFRARPGGQPDRVPRVAGDGRLVKEDPKHVPEAGFEPARPMDTWT